MNAIIDSISATTTHERVKAIYDNLTKSLCSGAHKRIPIRYDLWTKFLAMHFNMFRLY